MIHRNPQREIQGNNVHGKDGVGEIVKAPGEDCELFVVRGLAHWEDSAVRNP